MIHNKEVKIYNSVASKFFATKKKDNTHQDAISKAEQNHNLRQARTIKDIKKDLNEILAGKEYVFKAKDAHVLMNSDPNYTPGGGTKPPASKSLNELLESLKVGNFFEDVSTGKISTGSQLIQKAVDYNNKLNYSHNTAKVNMSIPTMKSAYENFKTLQNQKDGKLFIYDLETIGADDISGIWRPLNITEYSMHTVDLATDNKSQVNVFLGMPEKEANKLQERVLSAIDDGTIDNIPELRVTAMRMSMYGNDKTKIEPTKEGYYEVKKFVGGDEAQYKNKELIERGFTRSKDAYKNTPMSNEGIDSATKAVIDSVFEAKRLLAGNKAIIMGQNHTVFDQSIINKYLQDVLTINNQILNSTTSSAQEIKRAQDTLKYINHKFGNDISFNLPSGKSIDTLALFATARENFGINKLYAGNEQAILNAGKKTAGQEYLGEAFYPSVFKTGEAHAASFDVDILRRMAMEKVEIGGIDMPLLDYVMTGIDGKGIMGLDNKAHKIKTGEQLFLATNTHTQTSYKGQGHLGFSINQKTGEVFTASNVMLDKNNKAVNAGFNLGTGLTKGQFYTISGVQQITPTKELTNKLSQVLPEYSTGELYSVSFNLQTTDEFSGILDDMNRTVFFKTQDEAEGFISSHAKLVANKVDGSWAIEEDAKEYMELRKVSKGKTVVAKDYWEQTDDEIVNKVVKHANKNVSASRAENSVMGDKLYKRVKEILDINNGLEKLGHDLSGLDIARVMSDKVAQGGIVQDISPEATLKIQNLVTAKSGYKGKLHNSTAKNIGVAYDHVAEQYGFYKTAVDAFDTLIEGKGYNKEQKQYMFSTLIEDLKLSMDRAYYQDNPTKVRNAVMNNNPLVTNTNELKNTYEFNLNINKIKDTNVKNIRANTLPKYDDVISIKTNNPNAHFDLINKLIKNKYGDLDIKSAGHESSYASSVLYDFIDTKNINSKNNKHLVQNQRYINTVEKIKSGNFNPYEAASELVSAMQETKSNMPHIGIIRHDVGLPSLLDVDKNVVANRNTLTPQTVKEHFENLPRVVDFNNKIDYKTYVENNVIHNYMPNKNKYLDSINFRSADEKYLLEQLYDDTYNKMLNNLTDTIKSTTNIKGMTTAIQSDGTLMLDYKGQVGVLDRIPKIGLNEDSGAMYIQVGEQKVALHSKINYDKVTGKPTYSSNVSDVLAKEGVVEKAVRRSIKDDRFNIDTINRIQANISKEMRESSNIKGFSAYNTNSNLLVDFSNIEDVMYPLFGHEGKLNHKTAGMDFMDEILPSYMKKHLREGKGLSPTDIQTLIKSVKDISLGLADEGTIAHNVIKNVNFSEKEGKVTKLTGRGGSGSLSGGALNEFDNLQRPVIGTAGQGKLIKESDIDKAIRNTDGLLLKGPIADMDSTHNQIFRKVYGIGNTTTDITYRTAYVGNVGIQAILDLNANKVINEASIGNLTKVQKEKVYAHLYSMVNTFEQQKSIDSRVIENVYGEVSANVQRLSKSQDIIKSLDSSINKDNKEMYEELIRLTGNLEVIEGKLQYTSGVGKIVKRGDAIVNTAAYGGTSKAFASKMQNGVLNFNILSETDNMRLSDSSVTDILNGNKEHFMENGEFVTGNKLKNRMLSLLEKKGLLGTFEIEDANLTTLPKFMDNSVEKSMVTMNYAKTGSINSNIKNFFSDIGFKDAVNGGTVLSSNAVDAYMYEASKNGIDVQEIMSKYGIKDIKQALKEERHSISEMLYGHIFDGYTAIGNDGLLKHGNKGSMTLSAFGEAVSNLARHNHGGDNSQGYAKALNQVVSLINDNKKYQFLGENINGSFVPRKVSAKGTTLQIGNAAVNAQHFNENNQEALVGLFEEIDKLTKASERDIDKLVHENIHIPNGKGGYDKIDKYVGGGLFLPVMHEGKEIQVAYGSSGLTSSRMLNDTETQSGMTQEFIDLKSDLMNLRKEQSLLKGSTDPRDIERLEILNKEMAHLSSRIDSYSDVVKHMKMGDQELRILRRYQLDVSTENLINKISQDEELSRNLLTANVLKGTTEVDANGRIGLTSQYKNTRVLDPLAGRIRDSIYYNKYEELELSHKDVTDGEFTHLKNIYEEQTGKGRKLGQESGQKIYDLQNAVKAHEYNNLTNKWDSDGLIKSGFEDMHISNYVNTFGKVDDVIAKDVHKSYLLDMGEGFNTRHLAIPGLGAQVGDSEIVRPWQQSLNRLSGLYGEYSNLNGLEGADKDLLVSKINEEITNIKELTSTIYDKNNVIHSELKVNTYMAGKRLKTLGVVGNVETPSLAWLSNEQKAEIQGIRSQHGLLENSMIGEKSIADWEKQGVFYDYQYMGKEQFKDLGFYKDETLKKYGFTEEAQMDEFLKTRGSLEIRGRYPMNMEGSITPTYTFLAEGPYANNGVITAAHTELKRNADSDGDSDSGFTYKSKDDTDYGLYTKHKLDAEAAGLSYDDEESFKSFMNARGISNDTYDEFRRIEISMHNEAIGANRTIWRPQVEGKVAKDAMNNHKSNSIYADQYNTAELEGGKSILGQRSYSRTVDASVPQKMANETKVNDMLQLAYDNKHLVDAKDVEMLSSLDSAGKITDYGDSVKVIDEALNVLGSKELGLSEDVMRSFEQIGIERVRIDKYAQEQMAKTGKLTTGTVNVSVAAIKQAAQDYYDGPNKDNVARSIIYNINNAKEEAAISSKKHKVDWNENKVTEYGEIIREMRSPNKSSGYDISTESKDRMRGWINKYVGEDFLVNQYNELDSLGELDNNILKSNSEKLMVQKNISMEEATSLAKRNIIEDKYMSSLSTLLTDEQSRATIEMIDVVGRNRHGRGIEKSIPAQNSNSMTGEYIATLHNNREGEALRNASEAKASRYNAARQARENASELATSRSGFDMASAIGEGLASVQKSGKHSLAGAAIGLAAGLLVSGYAGGNPLNDANPETITGYSQNSYSQEPNLMDASASGVSGQSNSGYIINIKADTKKGQRHIKRAMNDAITSSAGGAVSVNMNIKNKGNKAFSDRDIERWLESNL